MLTSMLTSSIDSRNVDIYRHQASGLAVTEERDVDVDVRMTQPLVTLSQDALSGLWQRPLCQPDVGPIRPGETAARQKDHGSILKLLFSERCTNKRGWYVSKLIYI